MARTPLIPRSDVRSSFAGFTLVELLTTVTILGIVLATGTPALRELHQRQRAIALTNSLVAHLHHARLHAITHRVPTVLCPTTDGLACSENSDWTGGWAIFPQPEGTKPSQGSPAVLMEATTRGRGTTIISSGGRKQVRYLPDGRSSGSNTTISICVEGFQARQVIINNAGRVRISVPAAGMPCS